MTQGQDQRVRGFESRERLLAAARELIPELGWSGVSARLLGDRARVAASAAHYHFGSVQGVLAEAAIESLREAGAGLVKLLESHDDPAGGLAAMLSALDAQDTLDAHEAQDPLDAHDALDAQAASDAQDSQAALDDHDAQAALDSQAALDDHDAQAALDAQDTLDAQDAHAQSSVIAVELYLAAARDPALRDRVVALLEEFRGWLAAWLADRGQPNAEVVAAVLAAALDGIMLHRTLDSRDRITSSPGAAEVRGTAHETRKGPLSAVSIIPILNRLLVPATGMEKAK